MSNIMRCGTERKKDTQIKIWFRDKKHDLVI